MRALQARRRGRRGQPGPRRITCVLGDLELGGVPRVHLDVLSELAGRGVACRIVAPDGPLRSAFEDAGVAWAPVDWSGPRRATHDRVAGLVADGEASVSTADPRTMHVLPALAGRGPTVIAFHGSPYQLGTWFEAGRLRDLFELARGLTASRRARILTIGETYADRYAETLGVPRERVGVLPAAVRVAEIPFAPRAGPAARVLSLCRLGPEKAAHVGAAVALVEQRLRAGRPCVLEIVGDGPWRREAEALCAAELPADAFAFRGATTEPLRFHRETDVFVGTGIAALEAAACGARVAIARARPDGAGVIGPALTPGRYGELMAKGFATLGGPVWGAADVWAELDALSPTDLRAIRRRIERENDVAAVADALAGAFALLGKLEAQPATVAVGEVAAALDDRRAEAKTLADQLWAERERERERDADEDAGGALAAR